MGFSTKFKIIKQILSKKLIFNALVSSFGAFLCISFLAFLNGIDESTLWLIPPFGASMVLVMSAHDSPLAQPKNIFLVTHCLLFQEEMYMPSLGQVF